MYTFSVLAAIAEAIEEEKTKFKNPELEKRKNGRKYREMVATIQTI